MIHVLPEKKLGPISWKKQEWKQSLIHSALIFLEKALLKACLAVSSDSETWQCLSCPFLLAPFPKCSYCTFRGYKPTLLMCSFSNTFQTPAGRFPHPSGLPCVMLWLWLPLSSILSTSSPHFPPQALQQPFAEHRGGVTGLEQPSVLWFLLHFHCTTNTFSPLRVCGWKTSETVFLIETSIWVNFDSSYFTSPLPSPQDVPVLLLLPFLHTWLRLPRLCHTKISMWGQGGDLFSSAGW